jgi:hypothetical protein
MTCSLHPSIVRESIEQPICRFESDKHSISINGQALPRFDIPEGSGGKWQLWMDLIPAGFLTPGENRITIARVKRNDNFFIGNR